MDVKTTQLADITVAYHEAGTAAHEDRQKVVFIHGLAEDHSSWAQVQAALPEYHSYAYDVRGHGLSTAGAGAGTLAQLGDDLLRFLEQVSGPAVCVGFSLGGTIVLWAAGAAPHLVQRPVAVATSSVVGKRAAAFYRERIALAQEDITQLAPLLIEDTRAQLVTALGQTEAVASRRIRAVGEGLGYINAARAMAALHDAPLTPRLAELKQTVELITGHGDQFCPQKAADIMLAALPRAHQQDVAAAGHLLSVDQPEAYAEAIRQAITRTA